MRLLLLVLALLAAAPAGAAAAPAVHADRGAHTLDGAPAFGEGTPAAYDAAHRPYGAVIGLDTRLTADEVPVAVHDDTLDRTTSCSGRVRDRTLAQLAECRVDVLGSPGATATVAAACPQPVPTVGEVLALARDVGARVQLEISEGADRVVDAVVASGLPAGRLIVRSFAPADLEVAQSRLPGVETALATHAAGNSDGIAAAVAGGYEWVSPEWPVDGAYVSQARSAGRRIAPFTLHDPADVQAAAALGVDAVVVDDVVVARRALGLAELDPPPPVTCAPPALPAPATPPAVELLVPELASDAFSSPRMTLRWRGRGADDAGVEAFLVDIRPVGARLAEDWRALVAGQRRRETRFTGLPGATYDLRAQARTARSAYGPAATATITVPRDDRDRLVKRSPGWRTVRRAGAWNGAVSASARSTAQAALRFSGRRLRVIARRSPGAGRLAVTVDGRRRVVPTAGPVGARRVVFDSGRLRPGRHRATVRPAGGRVELDALAPGP